MKRILLLIPIAIIGALIYVTFQTIEKKEELKSRLSAFPEIKLISLEGEEVMIKASLIENENSVVIILFNTECDFCAYETKEIVENIADFPPNSRVVFISDEELDALQRFSDKYEFTNYDILSVYQLQKGLAESFGVASTPAIFIYNDLGDLVKQYTGETTASAIINHLTAANDEY